MDLDNDDMSLFDVVDKKHAHKKKNHWQRLRGKLRKSGFAEEEFAREYMITMDKEKFEEIANEQIQNHTVTSSHKNFEKFPLMRRFEDALYLEKSIWRILDHYDFLNPLPVQRIAIPYIMCTNADMIVNAQPGSGKTHAFILPIISKILELKRGMLSTAPNNDSPYALIVAPTKELTKQLARDVGALVHQVYNVNVQFAIGGQHDPDFKRNCYNKGVDILVLTAGKLYEFFLDPKKPSQLFKTNNLRFVVLDEADQMVDDRPNRDQKDDGPGSFYDTMHSFIVKYLTEQKRHLDFRVLMFGATIGNTNENLNKLAKTNDWFQINVGKKQPVRTVIQSFMTIDAEFQRKEKLEEVIEYFAAQYNGPPRPSSEFDYETPKRRIKKTLIFVNNKRLSDRLAHLVITKGFLAKSINSDRTAQQREDAIQELIRGKIDVLVATDALAFGMNIPNLELVINYNFPNSLADYQHRISRTGRIGNEGSAITFFDPKRDYRYALDLLKGCVENGQEEPMILRSCINHYYQINNGSAYNRFDYSLRQPFQRYTDYNKRRPSYSDEDYFSGSGSSCQTSPDQYQ